MSGLWRFVDRFCTGPVYLSAPMTLAPETISPLSQQEARYAEQLLQGCAPEHLSGLVHLMRFGVASSGEVTGSYVAAAWMLNSARFVGLPQTHAYSRSDGTGFVHCDPDWLASKSASEVSDLRKTFFRSLKSVGAKGFHLGLRDKDSSEVTDILADELERNRPTVLIISTSTGVMLTLVLAVNVKRQQFFCCEVEASRARLRWANIELLLKRVSQPGGDLELASMTPDGASTAAELERSFRGTEVEYLDTLRGRELLLSCEGLSTVAYAALHGNTQRDLSSCQVASLSSLALRKGARAQMTDVASAVLNDAQSGSASDVQAVLRSLATQQLREEKGLDFSFRGLGVDELSRLGRSVGLQVSSTELFEGAEHNADAVDAFRRGARGALGRTIVNFSRLQLDQQKGGHHAVVVAYHPKEDLFLIDDPAGFKMPPYWVETRKLFAAMATFDDVPGVQRYRGYLIVDSPHAVSEEPELSMSVVLQKKPKSQ